MILSFFDYLSIAGALAAIGIARILFDAEILEYRRRNDERRHR